MKILTAEDVASLLCASPETISRMARKGQLTGFKVGKDWRFKQEVIEAYIDHQSEVSALAKERIQKAVTRFAPIAESMGSNGARPVRRSSRDVIILTAHEGAVEWLHLHNYYGVVMEFVTKEDVTGKVVIESSNRLPPYLGCLAAKVGIIEMPYSKNLGPDKKNDDLTPNDMDRAGAQLVWYTFHKIEEE